MHVETKLSRWDLLQNEAPARAMSHEVLRNPLTRRHLADTQERCEELWGSNYVPSSLRIVLHTFFPETHRFTMTPGSLPGGQDEAEELQGMVSGNLVHGTWGDIYQSS